MSWTILEVIDLRSELTLLLLLLLPVTKSESDLLCSSSSSSRRTCYGAAQPELSSALQSVPN